MPEPITVWMVHLGAGEPSSGVKGTLALQGEALVFTDRDLRSRHFHRSQIRRARRLRGSPVLQLDWTEAGTVRRTAFYFVEPPPLATADPLAVPTSPSGRPLGGFGALRRSSKRRRMRQNVSYLQVYGADKRADIQAWAEEITALLASEA